MHEPEQRKHKRRYYGEVYPKVFQGKNTKQSQAL